MCVVVGKWLCSSSLGPGHRTTDTGTCGHISAGYEQRYLLAKAVILLWEWVEYLDIAMTWNPKTSLVNKSACAILRVQSLMWCEVMHVVDRCCIRTGYWGIFFIVALLILLIWPLTKQYCPGKGPSSYVDVILSSWCACIVFFEL